MYYICTMEKNKSTKLLTLNEFVISCNKIHDNKYKYDKFIYVNGKTKGIIICSTHGEFEQIPNSHLNGRGCPSCGKLKYKKKSNVEEFISKATKIHKYKYQYNNFEYFSAITLSSITCSIHGDFKQNANNHLNGHGCPKCGKESHWRKTDYIKKANGRLCIFYTLKCFNEYEEFYKIGITFTSIEKRYSSKIPYNFEIISYKEGDAGFIWDLELSEKRKLKEYKYKPLLDFKGSKTECFTKF